jgi:predicted CoA-substrate-specific enzyme activase
LISIGIDIGSTYTKYCVLDGSEIKMLSSEKTPVRQKEYFEKKVAELNSLYPGAPIVSCGYGKNNAGSGKTVSELVALAAGAGMAAPEYNVVLDIGGQDTKIIVCESGKLKEFFVNDKCAAGCGMFVVNSTNLLQTEFGDIKLGEDMPSIKLSSTCAVFAQSEITELIADNAQPDEIMKAVIWQILVQSKVLLGKVRCDRILFTGGLTQIPGIERYAASVFGMPVTIPKNSVYLSAIGAAIIASN